MQSKLSFISTIWIEKRERKRAILTAFVFFTLLYLWSCSNRDREGAIIFSADEDFPEMVKIKSKGMSFNLGSNSENILKIEESPRPRIEFGYDYSLDATEVTQGLWNDLMTKDSPATEKTGIGRNLPVYGITWYDALLFCNARSKKWNLDTVYVYDSVGVDIRDEPGIYMACAFD